jgi:hypothetical protein
MRDPRSHLPKSFMRQHRALVPAILLATACTTFTRVPPNEPIPEQAIVAVSFEEPRDLQARSETKLYPLLKVGMVYGEVERTHADTLVLRVLEVQSTERQPRLPSEARLLLTADSTTQLSVQRVSKSGPPRWRR